MKLALALALLLALCARPDATRCFKKYQFCCFKYAPCGYHAQRVRGTKPCDYRRCARACHDKCAAVAKYVPERACRSVKVLAGCPDRPYHAHCKPVYKYERRCAVNKVRKEKVVCRKVCAPKCYYVKAVCVFHKVLHYPRFCAKAHCGPFKIHGDDKAPAPYNGKHGKLVKVVPGPRIDLKH